MAEDNAVVLRLDAVHKQYESADRDPVPVLKGITERLIDLDPDFGENIAKRLRSKKKGVVLALHGHVASSTSQRAPSPAT